MGGDRVLAVVTCEALTERGERCRREGQYEVEIDGRPVLLCAPHRRQAERGDVTIQVMSSTAVAQREARRGPPQPWRSEEIGWLIEHPEASLAEAGAYLGRSVDSVYQRRLRLRREGRG